MVTSSLCRCICGSGKGDHFPSDQSFGRCEISGFDESPVPYEPNPQVSGMLSYHVLADQPLRGVPIREGELYYLSAEETVDQVTLSLFVNGFSFSAGGQEISVSMSPFALVRNCKFGSSYSATMKLSDFKIFKISLYTQGICYYFGVKHEDERVAEEERSRWVLDISRAMRLVTQSIFPPFRISCDPIESVASTKERLMAGYLIHHEDAQLATVLYCELHSHWQDTAKLVCYENELCQAIVMTICLNETSICCEKIGINCSCFCIEDHQFGTRTLAERKLWLRAISNVKVKLQNRAPNPSEEDICYYRRAIKEHLKTIRDTLEVKAPTDALLQRGPSETVAQHTACDNTQDGDTQLQCSPLEQNGAGDNLEALANSTAEGLRSGSDTMAMGNGDARPNSDAQMDSQESKSNGQSGMQV